MHCCRLNCSSPHTQGAWVSVKSNHWQSKHSSAPGYPIHCFGGTLANQLLSQGLSVTGKGWCCAYWRLAPIGNCRFPGIGVPGAPGDACSIPQTQCSVPHRGPGSWGAFPGPRPSSHYQGCLQGGFSRLHLESFSPALMTSTDFSGSCPKNYFYFNTFYHFMWLPLDQCMPA